MKKKFSIAWKGSKQPRKQIKYRENAPLNIATKMLSANLSKTLRKQYGKRNIPIRKNDEVKILRGEFNGKTGKVLSVNRNKGKVVIEGIQRKKKDGTKINVYFDPSTLQIQTLETNDKKRLAALNRKMAEKKNKEVKTKEKVNTKEVKVNNQKKKNTGEKK